MAASMKPIRHLFLVATSLILFGCTGNYKQRTEESLQRYLDAAGAPVKSFRYFSIHSWTPLGRAHVAIWTRPREVWLLKVHGPCNDLEFAQNIGITSSLKHVYARFDKIIAGPIPCRIDQIQPVNVVMLRALESEARNRRTDISVQDSEQRHTDSPEDS